MFHERLSVTNKEYLQQSLYLYSCGRQKEALAAAKTALTKFNQLLQRGRSLPRGTADQVTLCMNVYEKLKANKKDILSIPDIILYISSKVGSYCFYPWSPPNLLSLEEQPSQLFEDPDGLLSLSKIQIKRLDSWKRPREALGTEPSMVVPTTLDVHQDMLHDCSLVSSFLSIFALNNRTKRNLVVESLYPRDDNGPLLSPSGRYIVRLNVNGAFRRVVVDDRLPCSNDGSSLFLYSQSGILWPALIEKAYVKVMGGYDFAGSHAAFDTFALTEWIPEYISLKAYSETTGKTPEQLWQKLKTGWYNGDLMVCVGTGTLLQEETHVFRLASNHDYAVLDLDDKDGAKRLQVRNPWERRERRAESTSWIDLNTLFRQFDHLYLNWNPRLYRYKTSTHFSWSVESVLFGQNCNSLLKCPQYTVSNGTSQDAMVSLLVVRHLTGPEMLAVQSEYLRLTVYNTTHQIALAEEVARIQNGPAVNTSYITMNLTIPAGTKVLVALSSENLQPSSDSLRLSLIVYSSQKMALEKAKPVLDYRASIEQEWTKDSSPGNWSMENFHTNPQFQFTVNRDAKLVQVLGFSPLSVPIHIFIFWGNGKPIKGYSETEVVASSGKYRKNHAVCEVKDLRRGVYTVVISAYEPVTGPFSIFAFSDVPLSLSSIKAQSLVRNRPETKKCCR